MDEPGPIVVAGEQQPPDGAQQFVGLYSRYAEVQPVSFYSYVWVVVLKVPNKEAKLGDTIYFQEISVYW